jgi:hypothetical protein
MHIYDTHFNTWQQGGAYVVLTWHSHGVNVTCVAICSHVEEHMFSNGNPNFKVLGTCRCRIENTSRILGNKKWVARL